MLNTGRLAGTGYVSILPVDQGIEHSAGASFAPTRMYFDPENIVKLAIEGGCNAVASTLGVLGVGRRKYAHKIPFMVKFNHNEFLTYPNTVRPDHVRHRSKQAFDMGAVAVGATIYFGSDESDRQIQEVAEAFAEAHELGMVTVLWCYLRNTAFKVKGADGKSTDYHTVRRPHRPGEPPRRHDRGRHHQAEAADEQRRLRRAQHRRHVYGKIDKQRLHRTSPARRERQGRPPDRPVPLPGRQLLHGPHAADQLRRRVQGRQRPGRSGDDRRHQQARRRHGPDLRPQGVPAPDEGGRELLNAIQDVYLDESVTVA